MASFFEYASAGVISVGSVVAVDVVRIEIIARVFWWQIYVSELLKILSCSRDGDGDYTNVNNNNNNNNNNHNATLSIKGTM